MDYPRTAITIAYDIIICFEADGRGQNHIKEILGINLFLLVSC